MKNNSYGMSIEVWFVGLSNFVISSIDSKTMTLNLLSHNTYSTTNMNMAVSKK
jgi:hypothetical protein